MPVTLLQIDAFTDRAFAGNPAGVCLLEKAAQPDWMQSVAAEMNLSETAFVVPRPVATPAFDLRWFTPACEVDLCGHATLASSHALWEAGWLPPDQPARFHTASGLLVATRSGRQIDMDFPAESAEPAAPPAGLLEAVGAEARFVGRNRMDWLIELDSARTVVDLRPDIAGIARAPARGVIVTAVADDPRFDFVSRFFAPQAGIDEDPVTGSAHCCLGPYWQGRLNKNPLRGHQASKRGGIVGVTVRGGRVTLTGQAVTVFRGELVA